MDFKEHICTQLLKLNFNINNSHIFTRKHPFAQVILQKAPNTRIKVWFWMKLN